MRTAACCILVALGLSPLAVVATAAAQERDLQVSVTPQSAVIGDEVQGTLTGCEPGQPAQIALAIGPGGVIRQGDADAQGTFVASLPLPDYTEPGAVPVAADCSGGVASATLTALARGTTAPGGSGATGGMSELPMTGPTDVLPEAALGAALVALGAALTLAGRRPQASGEGR